MSDEFVGDSEHPDDGVKPGQPSGTADDGADQQQKPVNLDDFPEFRQFRSNRDKKEAEMQQRMSRLEYEVNLAQQKAARMQNLIENVGDGDMAQVLAQEAELVEIVAERDAAVQQLDAYRQQAEQDQRVAIYRQQCEDRARRVGIDPFSGDFQGAIQQALRTGDGGEVDAAIDKLLTQKRQAAAPPATPEPTPQQPASHAPLPPSGGRRVTDDAQRQELERQYREEIAQAKRRGTTHTEIPNIRHKYRTLGLDV